MGKGIMTPAGLAILVFSVACGVPHEDHAEVVKERDELKALNLKMGQEMEESREALSKLLASMGMDHSRSGDDHLLIAEELEYAANYVDIVVSEARLIDPLTSDLPEPGIQFSVTNNGSRSIRNLKVMVYYLNASEGRIGEADYYLVFNMGTRNDTGILRSGYSVRQPDGDSWMTHDSLNTAAWDEGSVEIEVIALQFEP